MLQERMLQYFRPSLNLSLRPLFCLFLSDCLRPVLLYSEENISTAELQWLWDPKDLFVIGAVQATES